MLDNKVKDFLQTFYSSRTILYTGIKHRKSHEAHRYLPTTSEAFFEKFRATKSNSFKEYRPAVTCHKRTNVTVNVRYHRAHSSSKQILIDLSKQEFKIPKKEIYVPDDMPKWEKSKAYHELMGFILTMNEAVKGKKIREENEPSQPVKDIMYLLDALSGWVDEIPPIEQPQRFGNKAFRVWFAKLQDNAEDLVRNALDEKCHKAVSEISQYLVESFGNSTRIDYGTGHEMSFSAFLCCLFKIGALQETDSSAVVLLIHEKYLQLLRKLQTVYRMEPAGSHGVWSLDDFQFIPFIWGSSQLIDHAHIFPASFVKPEVYEHFAKDYIFLGCIKYINQVKTGVFAEHSNQLWNISGVPNWKKVNTGLIKMYQAEVLAKFPVIQHFLFGSLMSIQPVS